MKKYFAKVDQLTINQRLIFLIEKLAVSARAFSESIGESPTNTHNYIGTRQLAPKHEYLAKVVRHYPIVNALWLLTGEGEPFLGEAPAPPVNVTNKKNKGPVQSSTGSHATNNITNNIKLEECQRDLEAMRKDAAAYQREIALLQGQLKDKEEIITLLRGGYNRPN